MQKLRKHGLTRPGNSTTHALDERNEVKAADYKTRRLY